MQETASWVQGLDPALKSSVATWATYWSGALGAGAALSKIAGIAGSAIGALGQVKTALAVVATNPFGLAIAGLGVLAATAPGAFKPLIDAGREVGPVLQQAFTAILPAIQAVGTALAGLAGGALLVVADTVRVTVAALDGLGAVFGTTGGKLLGFGAVAYAVVSGLRSLAAAFAVTQVGMAATSALASTLTLGFGIAAGAARALSTRADQHGHRRHCGRRRRCHVGPHGHGRRVRRRCGARPSRRGRRSRNCGRLLTGSSPAARSRSRT